MTISGLGAIGSLDKFSNSTATSVLNASAPSPTVSSGGQTTEVAAQSEANGQLVEDQEATSAVTYSTSTEDPDSGTNVDIIV